MNEITSLRKPALRFGTVILAAGASSRMGRPKLLLPWGTTSVLGHIISEWRNLGAEQIAAVRADGDQAVVQELDRLGIPARDQIINPAPELGMFSSIQCAARWPNWRSSLSHWIITLGDQPHLSRETLGVLIDFGAVNSDKICQLSRDGRPRHPVLLPKDAFTQLMDSPEASLKTFLQAGSRERAYCPMDDPALDLDIDYPADYERALELFSKRAGG